MVEGVAVDHREVAGQGVLAAEGELAELAADADPGVTVEEDVGLALLAVEEEVLALQLVDDVQPVDVGLDRALEAPAVAAEEGFAHVDLGAAIGRDIALGEQGQVDEDVGGQVLGEGETGGALGLLGGLLFQLGDARVLLGKLDFDVGVLGLEGASDQQEGEGCEFHGRPHREGGSG